jgi:hypothetical protein
MLHYVAVLVPQIEGSWRVYFPDFPGCCAEGAYLEQAIGLARKGVYQQLDTSGVDGTIPFPCSLDGIVADLDWARALGVDWRRAVISLVPFAHVASAMGSQRPFQRYGSQPGR